MADIACPAPLLPSRDELRAMLNKVKREFPDLKIGALRRETARRMDLDYKTFMDIWDKRINPTALKGVTKLTTVPTKLDTVWTALKKPPSTPPYLGSRVIRDAVNVVNAEGRKYISNVDPSRWIFGSREYSINCQKTAFATELRLRGLNVVAESGRGTAKVYSQIRNQWVNLPGEISTRSWEAAYATDFGKVITRSIARDPVNSRYIIDVTWADGGGHVINGIKLSDGTMQLFDGQVGKYDVTADIYSRALRIMGFRVDNMIPRRTPRNYFRYVE